MSRSVATAVGTITIVALDAEILDEQRTSPSELLNHPKMSAAAGSAQAVQLSWSQFEI